MPTPLEDMVDTLLEIYEDDFAGKKNQRYLIQMNDLRKLYGLRKMHRFRFEKLAEFAESEGLYLLDLGESESGHPIAVISCATVDRWRQVPKRIIEGYVNKAAIEGEEETDLE
ncbi:MAG: hypothetical protein IPL99_24740 [Candidatus Competibacteraceae bacterium]|nr:hypothetical protein [Candidatus Competibacteraceae bacterium]